jgi:hypothetical protein
MHIADLKKKEGRSLREIGCAGIAFTRKDILTRSKARGEGELLFWVGMC